MLHNILQISMITLFAYALGGCKKLSQPKESLLKHESNHPVGDNMQGTWTEITFEEFVNVAQVDNSGKFGLATKASNYLPSNSPIVQRLQYWSDQFDQMLRQRYPAKLRGIPKPTIAVLDYDAQNARVAAIGLCYDNVVLRIKTNSSSAVSDEFAVITDGIIWNTRNDSNQNICRHVNASFDEINAVVNLLNETNGNCKLHVTALGQEQFELSHAGCQISPRINRFDAARFTTWKTVPIIAFYSGLLRSSSEDVVVGVLAHELAHYYHGHVLPTIGRYNYFYNLLAKRDDSKPQPFKQQANLERDVNAANLNYVAASEELAAITSQMPHAIYPSIPGQKFHAALFQPIILFASDYKARCEENGEEEAACLNSQCVKFIEQLEISTFLNRYLYSIDDLTGTLSTTEVTGYLRLEPMAEACINEITVKNQKSLKIEDTNYLTQITSEDVFYNISWSGYGLGIRYLMESPSEGTLASILQNVNQKMMTEIPAFSSASFEEFKKMKLEYSRKILAQDMAKTRVGSFSNIAEQWKLGWYTTEQEADELGIEWLSYLGFNPRLMGDFDLDSLKFDGERILWEECARQREANWLGEGNRPIVLAWGPLDELHPKSCFRVNNSDREIMTHNYPIPARSPSEGLRPTWGELVAGIGGVIEPEFEDDEESDDAETEVTTSALTKLKASCRHHPLHSMRHRKSKNRQMR